MIEDYNRLADIYVMLGNAYGRKTMFYSELAHKTERLVRESATAYVIVHELLHFRVPNHGKLFKSMLTAYLPGWRRLAVTPDLDR